MSNRLAYHFARMCPTACALRDHSGSGGTAEGPHLRGAGFRLHRRNGVCVWEPPARPGASLPSSSTTCPGDGAEWRLGPKSPGSPVMPMAPGLATGHAPSLGHLSPGDKVRAWSTPAPPLLPKLLPPAVLCCGQSPCGAQTMMAGWAQPPGKQGRCSPGGWTDAGREQCSLEASGDEKCFN